MNQDDRFYQALLMAVGGNEDAAKALLDQAAQTNREIEQQDLMRRAMTNPLDKVAPAKNYEDGTIHDKDVVLVGRDVIDQVAVVVLTSQEFNDLKERLAKVEMYENRITALERDLAQTQVRQAKLEREDEEKVTEALNSRRSNRAVYLTLDNGATTTTRAATPKIHENDALFQVTQANALQQQWIKEITKGGK